MNDITSVSKLVPRPNREHEPGHGQVANRIMTVLSEAESADLRAEVRDLKIALAAIVGALEQQMPVALREAGSGLRTAVPASQFGPVCALLAAHFEGTSGPTTRSRQMMNLVDQMLDAWTSPKE